MADIQQKSRSRKLIPLKYSCEEVYERMENGLCIFCEEKDSPEHQKLKHKGILIVCVEDDQMSEAEEISLPKTSDSFPLEPLRTPCVGVNINEISEMLPKHQGIQIGKDEEDRISEIKEEEDLEIVSLNGDSEIDHTSYSDISLHSSLFVNPSVKKMDEGRQQLVNDNGKDDAYHVLDKMSLNAQPRELDQSSLVMPRAPPILLQPPDPPDSSRFDQVSFCLQKQIDPMSTWFDLQAKANISKETSSSTKNMEALQTKGSFTYALAVDESVENREHGLTVTVAVAYFNSEKCHVVSFDSPGHKDLVPNKLAGVTQAGTARKAKGNVKCTIVGGEYICLELRASLKDNNIEVNILGSYNGASVKAKLYGVHIPVGDQMLDGISENEMEKICGKEAGTAVIDLFNPDRVVIGGRETPERLKAVQTLKEVYARFNMYLAHTVQAYFLREVKNVAGGTESGEFYNLPSADEAEMSKSSIDVVKKLQIPVKSRSYNYDYVSHCKGNGKIVGKPKILRLVFGGRSVRETRFNDDAGDVSFMEIAELAGDLLDVKWSTNIYIWMTMKGGIEKGSLQMLVDSNSILETPLVTSPTLRFVVEKGDYKLEAQIVKVTEDSDVAFYMGATDLCSLDYFDCYKVIVQDFKAQEETLVKFANNHDGLLTCALRSSIVMGPGNTEFVPFLVNLAKHRYAKFIIGSGENMCDFTYSENVSHAHICAEEALDSQMEFVVGKEFFITNFKPIRLPARLVLPIFSFLKWIQEQEGLRSNYDTAHQFALLASSTRTFNCNAAKKYLGYTPVVTHEISFLAAKENMTQFERHRSVGEFSEYHGQSATYCVSSESIKRVKMVFTVLVLWKEEPPDNIILWRSTSTLYFILEDKDHLQQGVL